MTPKLETPRLLLSPLEPGDADQLQIAFPHWKVVRYFWNAVPWPYPSDGAIQFLNRVLPAIECGEEWHWTIRSKAEPGVLIGGINLMTKANNNRAFWLAPPWQGRGLMTEASEVVTDFWFHALKYPVLRASKAAINAASRRLSEKQGMRVVATEERDYICGRLLAEIWEITGEEWDARRHPK